MCQHSDDEGRFWLRLEQDEADRRAEKARRRLGRTPIKKLPDGVPEILGAVVTSDQSAAF
jgi:hypothetical protein